MRGPCPNCGYCPHCGRGGHGPRRLRPYRTSTLTESGSGDTLDLNTNAAENLTLGQDSTTTATSPLRG